MAKDIAWAARIWMAQTPAGSRRRLRLLLLLKMGTAAWISRLAGPFGAVAGMTGWRFRTYYCPGCCNWVCGVRTSLDTSSPWAVRRVSRAS